MTAVDKRGKRRGRPEDVIAQLSLHVAHQMHCIFTLLILKLMTFTLMCLNRLMHKSTFTLPHGSHVRVSIASCAFAPPHCLTGLLSCSQLSHVCVYRHSVSVVSCTCAPPQRLNGLMHMCTITIW
eukprot:218712-Pelagomonas_calceolata.AAC.3